VSPLVTAAGRRSLRRPRYRNRGGFSGILARTMDTCRWAGCLPEDGAVVVVLTNQVFDDIGVMAEPLVEALTSG
jgi:transposase